jgi:hypothetical protein
MTLTLFRKCLLHSHKEVLEHYKSGQVNETPPAQYLRQMHEWVEAHVNSEESSTKSEEIKSKEPTINSDDAMEESQLI